MARSRKVIRKKTVEADPLYGNRLVAKFTNKLMRDGKKSVAQNVVYQAFEILKTKGHDPAKLFETVIQTVSPRMEVRPRRIGGASYQVPTEVRGERRNSLAIRWILTAAKARSNKEYHTFAEKLAAEFLDILEGKGEAIRKRNVMHKTAESNRAFAHFRW